MPPLWPSGVVDLQTGGCPDPVRPADVADVCSDIRAATKGFGTDEEALIKALGRLGAVERYRVAKHYEEAHEKNLALLMKKECGNGDFGRALQLLAVPIDEAEAILLKAACKGMGTDEVTIYATLCGRAGEEVDAIKRAFLRVHGEGLGATLAGELGGDLRRLIDMILGGEFEEEEYDPDGVHTEERAEEDAMLLDEAGLGRMGTDEEGLFQVILRSPPEHLKEVNSKFVDRTGYSITKSLEKELGGDAKNAAIHTVNMKLKPVETAAHMIEKSMKGIGTDERLLFGSVLRYQMLLDSIRPVYEKEYGKTLEERVRGELSGDFEKLILEMISYKSDAS